MEEVKKLESQIKYWETKLDEKEDKWDWSDDTLSFEKYQEFLKPEASILSNLRGNLRMITPYELSELPEYGDVMTLDHFIDCCKSGGFINYDGYGRYVKDGKETNIEIYPSDVKNNHIRKDFDTIIWYNR